MTNVSVGEEYAIQPCGIHLLHQVQLFPEVGRSIEHPLLMVLWIDERKAGDKLLLLRAIPGSPAAFFPAARLRVTPVLGGSEHDEVRRCGFAFLTAAGSKKNN
jgi:hypothetical protein